MKVSLTKKDMERVLIESKIMLSNQEISYVRRGSAMSDYVVIIEIRDKRGTPQKMEVVE